MYDRFLCQAKYHIEDARLNWAMGNKPLAKLLIATVSDKKVVSFSFLTSQRIHGEYLVETRSEYTKNVINDYLNNSITRLENMKSNVSKLKDVAADDFDAFYTEHVLETRQLIAKCKHLISNDGMKKIIRIRCFFAFH